MHNPFFYKKKLLYQTKINLWGHDESFLGNKFTDLYSVNLIA